MDNHSSNRKRHHDVSFLKSTSNGVFTLKSLGDDVGVMILCNSQRRIINEIDGEHFSSIGRSTLRMLCSPVISLSHDLPF